MMQTSYRDVADDLVHPAGLRSRIDWWRRTRNPRMVEHILAFQHRALYLITPADVEATLLRSTHALGDVDASENHPVIRDASTDWAMEYLFHDCLEQHGAVPTWDDFKQYVLLDRASDWYDPILVIGTAHGLTLSRIHRAMQWRLGNAWQSSMREVYLLSSLHHTHGIPVKYHVLADVLLRVDGWHGRKLIYLRVPNLLELRKEDPARIFADHGFVFHRGAIDRQGFGRVWVPSAPSIATLASFLKEHL